MTTTNVSDRTLLIQTDQEQMRSIARLRVRRAAYRIVAECELLMDELLRSEHRQWSDAFGRVLIHARRLVSITAPGSASEHLFDEHLRPNTQIGDAQREIILAIAIISPALPQNAGEDAALRSVKVIRELATSMSDVPSLAAEAPGEASVKPTGRARVLVTDDDPNIRQLLQRMLQALGHDVTTATDGAEALQLVEQEPFDLMLTDIEMPNMDGITLLREVKSRDGTRRIPVIVISSKDDMRSVSTCIELGAEDHISKPFEPQLLNARVRASLDRKRLEDIDAERLRRVGRLIAAAEAVERDTYTSESLAEVTQNADGVGQLARVFDRMVTGLRSREERLRQRLNRLRDDVTSSGPREASGAVSESSPFKAGDFIAGRYEVLGQLGSGGMGMVYHARDRELGEEIALKIVRRELIREDPSVVERLKSEIRLARKISHPNVVRAHDLGEWDGRYFITMEKVQGVTVADLLDTRGRLSVESTLAIGTQLCDALAVAHDNHIIHRDIKPANLLVDAGGTLKVMDFGIARSLLSETPGQTVGGFVIGTPRYMAPELLMGEKATVSSDLFAVGVVLYECLTGRHPHMGHSLTELFAEILDAAAPPITAQVTGISPGLEALIMQQLRFDAGARASSARELGNRLSELEHGNAR